MGREEPQQRLSATGVRGLVANLFRHEAGRLVATLTRSFGPAHLDLAEEVVQEALVKALRTWPFRGVPDNPRAWLYQVARNRALDCLRRNARFRHRQEELSLMLQAAEKKDAAVSGVYFEAELTDDQLRLIFLCCHPDLPRDGRVALTLKTVCAFSVVEIARAFLVKETAIAQRLVRAQRRIRERQIPFEVPPPSELHQRLEAVLEVLYLMFNEGYATHSGEELVRADLCEEALRLVRLLTEIPATNLAVVHAAAALFHFQASRLPARVDGEGNLVLLDQQDRSLWNQHLIHRAFRHLEQAAEGEKLTPFHLQAAIAAHHAGAKNNGETDWQGILELYDQLVALQPSPVIALNRAVALARCRGPEAGLAALEDLIDHPQLENYHLVLATHGQLLLERGDPRSAVASFERALRCRCSGPERRLLESRLRECKKVEGSVLSS